MKNYTFILTFFILFCSCGKGNSNVTYQKPLQKNNDVVETINNNQKVINITGEWFYEVNSSENALLNKTFDIRIIVDNGIVKGQY